MRSGAALGLREGPEAHVKSTRVKLHALTKTQVSDALKKEKNHEQESD